MALKPWYQVVAPREDLREGKSLDASEFAVHLDQVRDGRAHADYQDPERFFSKTFPTVNLTALGGEVVRRLSGIHTQANAIFNMTTQFGGGKTHALTMLYHLARGGAKAAKWPGVDKILEKAGVKSVPEAAVAVFVGEKFDPLIGRGGNDGTPVRKTPWAEIAWQLGGKEALAVVAEHERQNIAPAGDAIRAFLPKDRPALILMDEVMNFVTKYRQMKRLDQFYAFLQSLSEEARNQERVVLCVSIPKSEGEMTAEDFADFNRLQKLLDRLGKPVIMSAETETSEIIRRRLFEWDDYGGLSRDAEKSVVEYAEWVNQHRNQVPSWFPVDHGREAFRATYPFHPSVLSVFERKWQELPRFQQTRGVLKLLALWVSRAYQEGYKGLHRDPLIGLGTAPLDDPFFRTAVFEQIGEAKLEGAVTTDICGKRESHAVRLDQEATEAVKKGRLHRKAMTAIFFESNGGQKEATATVPELRLDVGEPDIDIGNIDTVLEALGTACYYLRVEKNRYRFSLTANLNKLHADRVASISAQKIDERIRTEVKKVFTGKAEGIEVVPFPENSGSITNRPVLTLGVLPPEQPMDDPETKKSIAQMTKEYGKADRTYKTAVVWCVPHSAARLREEARKLLAWEDIQSQDDDRIDERDAARLEESVEVARRSIKEAVWQAYNTVVLLGKDNQLKVVDMGLLHSSSAESLTGLILKHLIDAGDVEKAVSPNFLIRKWPGFVEWSTKNVRDAFFASPLFPRLLNADTVKETISRGVTEGLLAYVGKKGSGRYEPFVFNKPLQPSDVEISDDVYIVQAEEAKKHVEPQRLTAIFLFPDQIDLKPGDKIQFRPEGRDQHGRSISVTSPSWTGTGGMVEPNGTFVAGDNEGTFTVEAKVGDVQTTATVKIAKNLMVTVDGGTGGGGTDGGKKVTETLSEVRWTGRVPPAKWMTFYTKVVAKHAKEKGLTLKASFELRPEQGLTKQQLDELRATLRELGLEDGLETA